MARSGGIEVTFPGKTSEPYLEIRIPAGTADPIELETAAGKIWRRDPAELPESLSTDALWERLRQDWAGRRGILTAVGAELGRWLFPAEAAADLRGRLERRCEGQAQLRVELRVPRERADFPWEIAALEGIQHLGIHPQLTVVRVSQPRSLAILGNDSALQSHEVPLEIRNSGPSSSSDR